MIENKEEILKGYGEIIQALTDTSKIDKESSRFQNELEIVTEMLKKCVEENAHSALDQADYEERYKTLAARYESIKKNIEEINEKRLERRTKQEKIEMFIKELEHREDLISEFDEELWLGTVEKVIVNAEDKLCFEFKDGMVGKWNGIFKRFSRTPTGLI